MCNFFLHTKSLIQTRHIGFSEIKNEKHTEESLGSKHSCNNANNTSGFSAPCRGSDILCHQRNKHPSSRRKPAPDKATRMVRSKRLKLLTSSSNNDNQHGRKRRSLRQSH